MAGDWTSIVITGASGGIGRVLARQLAAPGRQMLLTGRDAARLEAASEEAQSSGAEVETAVIDVTDAEAMASLLAAFEARAPVDLVIANAGVSAGRAPGSTVPLETAADMRRLVEINLMGAVNTVMPLLEPMVERKRGQVALMGSLAGLRPLPDMQAYSASKAGLRAWGTSLRGALDSHGVRVTVITPGFVTSPMSRRHKGFKPFEITAERAGEIICRGLARRRRLITFPWPLGILVWLGNRLPPGLSDLAIRGFAAEIEPE